jgi:hypothetical protein
MMSRSIPAATILTLMLCGCTETPAETKRDVSEAKQTAAESNDEAQTNANKEVLMANEKIVDEQQAQSETSEDSRKKITQFESAAMIAKARADFDVAITQAKGRQRVAKEKCDALDRAARNVCVSAVDATMAADESLAAANRDNALLVAEYHK